MWQAHSAPCLRNIQALLLRLFIHTQPAGLQNEARRERQTGLGAACRSKRVLSRPNAWHGRFWSGGSQRQQCFPRRHLPAGATGLCPAAHRMQPLPGPSSRLPPRCSSWVQPSLPLHPPCAGTRRGGRRGSRSRPRCTGCPAAACPAGAPSRRKTPPSRLRSRRPPAWTSAHGTGSQLGQAQSARREGGAGVAAAQHKWAAAQWRVSAKQLVGGTSPPSH